MIKHSGLVIGYTGWKIESKKKMRKKKGKK